MSGTTTLSTDTRVLRGSNAVAALILTEDGRYLLQHRDDIPGIWYPDHWGCFGGAVDPGETDLEAMTREIKEELGLVCEPQGPVYRMDYEIVGQRQFYRNYFEVQISDAELARVELGEGQKYASHTGAAILEDLRMTPYDAFAIYLHMMKERVRIVP